MSGRRTFVLVDGENIDATLGNSLLGRRPLPEERPRWERVTQYAADIWDQPVVGLFFLNASHGQLPGSFIQALLAMDYRPIPLAGRADAMASFAGSPSRRSSGARRQPGRRPCRARWTKRRR